MTVLQEHYKISKDWTGSRYLSLDLDWDYTKRKVHLSMLTYVTAALKRFNHAQPRKPQDQPYPHVKPIYGAKAQYAKDAIMSSLLSPANKKFVQEVTGTFLYYAQVVDTGGETDGTSFVGPKTWGELALLVAVFVEALLE